MISPDFIEDFIGREDARGARCEFFKKPHLAMGQTDGFFICQEDARLSVQSRMANRHTALCFGGQTKITLAPAKVRVKTRQEYGDGSLLDDVVVGACIERRGFVDFARLIGTIGQIDMQSLYAQIFEGGLSVRTMWAS